MATESALARKAQLSLPTNPSSMDNSLRLAPESERYESVQRIVPLGPFAPALL